MNELLLAQADSSGLGWLPVIVLGLYLCLLMGLGVYGYIKSKMTEEDYYLAGRQQGFIVTALVKIDPEFGRKKAIDASS